MRRVQAAAAILVIANKIVTNIKKLVPEDESVYVFTSGTYRIGIESFACVTSRGNATRLITKKGGGNLKAAQMKKDYGWVCTESLYKSTSAVNMNEVEKTVHKLELPTVCRLLGACSGVVSLLRCWSGRIGAGRRGRSQASCREW